MSDAIADIAAPAASSAAEPSAQSAGNDTSTDTSTSQLGDIASAQGSAPDGASLPLAQAAAPTYTPNFKYKAANEEKELDKFWHPLLKDADSEKKVKEVFTKIDAFDFIKSKREQAEQSLQSLSKDYGQVNQMISHFNSSIQQGDLSSAFRIAGITKDQIFKWTQQQLQLMEMPPEQRQQYEQFEQAQAQKHDLETKVSYLQQQYESQAVQARAVQLDVALGRPEVAKFAEAWDRNSEEPGAFKNFVIEEAKKVYYDTKQDLSPEQAIAKVMQRFGKFLNVGETTMQSPPAIPQNTTQMPKPVIPNVMGKAASPIKKVPKSLDELKRLAKEM